MASRLKGILNPEGKEQLTPTDLLEARKRLLNEFGKKILEKPDSSWTAEEKVASVSYGVLTENLHKMAPDMKNLDKVMEMYIKNDANNIFELLLKYIIKAAWFIIPILIVLALLKFIIH